jgi:FkbM family methyltransferase
MTQNNDIISSLFELIPKSLTMHSPYSSFHRFCSLALRKEVELIFSGDGDVEFGPFGRLIFPYFSMGNIDSLNLFDLDEVILFSFYWQNRNRYKTVLDIGANIGIHSIILSKCGFNVTSYEPEKTHYDVLKSNLTNNSLSSIKAIDAAVSYKNGETEFVVVKGNTTGSHIAGSKADPYGELEKYKVRLLGFENIIENADLIKMDVEGHEKEIICKSNPTIFDNFDLMLSIHDKENAKQIFDYFSNNNINMFSQKNNWEKVSKFEDMIITHHDGTLFVSVKDSMNWEELV